jgi:hypothetical protein
MQTATPASLMPHLATIPASPIILTRGFQVFEMSKECGRGAGLAHPIPVLRQEHLGRIRSRRGDGGTTVRVVCQRYFTSQIKRQDI